MPPLVSICLPIFNGERCLSEAIESALSQTAADFELLVADDRSSDKSYEIAQQYARKDNRIVVWQNESNKGLFDNYNETMRRATGKLIKPFAQDDVWDRQIVQKCISEFNADENLVLVAVRREWITATGEFAPVVDPYQFSATTRVAGAKQCKDCLLSLINWIGEPSTVMFPKAFVGSGFDSRYYHLGDLEFWIRLLLQGDYLYLHETLCRFRTHETSASRGNIKGLLFALDALTLIDQYATLMSDQGFSVDQLKTMAAIKIGHFVRFVYSQDPNVLQDFLSKIPESNEARTRQLTAFKQLAFYSLIAAGQKEEEQQNCSVAWQRKLNQVEQDLENVLHSNYWRSGALIRDAGSQIKKMFVKAPSSQA